MASFFIDKIWLRLYNFCMSRDYGMSKEQLYKSTLKAVQDYAKAGGTFDKRLRDYPFASKLAYLKRQPEFANIKFSTILKNSGVQYNEVRAHKREHTSLDKLRWSVEYYVQSGGDITKPIKEMPFYYMLGVLKKNYNLKTNDEVFKLAGIDFNKDYEEFASMVKRAQKYVVGGKLTLSRKNGGQVYSFFQERADLLGVSYYEYISLLTDLPSGEAIIKADYLDALRMMLYKKFPNLVVDRVKAGNKQVYEKIRNIQTQNRGQNITTEEIISMLGFKPAFPKTFYHSERKSVDEEALVSRIRKLEKEGPVTYSSLTKAGLYNDVLYCSYDNNISVHGFMEKHGIKYKKLVFKRLETIGMPDEFGYDIKKLKAEAIASIDNWNNLSDSERFYMMLPMVKAIHEKMVQKYTLTADQLKAIEEEKSK